MADTQIASSDASNIGSVVGAMTGDVGKDIIPPADKSPNALPKSSGEPIALLPSEFQGNARPPSDVKPDLSGHQQAHQYVQRWNAMEGVGADPKSSAVGGFLKDTWLGLMRETYPQTANMPEDQVLALRSNPQIHDQMVAVLGQKDGNALSRVGIEPSPTNLKLASWWGAGGAAKILTSPPDTPMDKVFPKSWLDVNPAAQGKTTGQIIDLVHQKMTQPTLKETLNTPSGMAEHNVQMATDAYVADMQNFAKTYTDIAAKTAPGSAERDKLLAEAHERRQKLVDEYENMVKHPPASKPVDAMQNFGSMASVLGLLVGLFARNHLTAALTASGMAMQAANSNNKDQFDRQMKIWTQESDAASKMIDLENQDIKMILDDKQRSVDEKQAQLSTLLTAHGAIAQAEQARITGLESVARLVEQRERLNEGAAKQKYDFSKMMADAEVQANPNKNPNEIYRKWGVVPGGNNVGSGKERELENIVTSDDQKWAEEHPNATDEEKKEAHYQHRLDREHELATATRNPRSGAAAATQAFIEETRKKTGIAPSSDDITNFNADYARKIATERVFGSGREAQQVTSMNTVVNHLDSLKKYAEALQNGDIRLANQLANRIAVETGKSAPTNFEMAKEIAGDEIARAVVGGVGALGDREAIKATISRAGSPDQLSGSIATAQEFLAGRLSELRRQYARGDKKREETFDNQMLSPLARERIGHSYGGALPSDLPSPEGHAEGSTLKDGDKVIAIIRNGKWVSP